MTTQHTDEMRAFEKYCHEHFDIYSKFECWQASAIRYEAALREAKGALQTCVTTEVYPDVVIDIFDTDAVTKALATIDTLLGESK